VVVEKPIALTLTELHQLRDAVEKAGVRSVVSFVLRWNPLIENIKAMLADKLIGNIGYAEVDYMHDIGPWYTGYEWIRRKRTGATVMLGGGCHAVDAMRWFLGQDAVEVFSFSAYGHGNRLNYEYETNCITAVKFAGGAIGKIGCSFEWIGPYVFNIVLSGDEGSIRNNQIITKRWPGQNGWATIPAVMPDTAEVSHHPFQAQMDHFVECILGKRESHANVADAVKTHEICIASEISAREGRAVQLPLKHA
jgi:predicted dehydrogenase